MGGRDSGAGEGDNSSESDLGLRQNKNNNDVNDNIQSVNSIFIGSKHKEDEIISCLDGFTFVYHGGNWVEV